MKIALTGIEQITASKTGKEYTRISGFNEKGVAVKAFMDAGRSTIPLAAAPSPSVVKQVFDMLPLADVEFDESGRVEEASLLDS